MADDKKEDKPDYRLPGEMLTAQLLAMMENWSGYGYELARKLEKTGVRGYNSGSLYRTLRQMEQHGLITSLWDTSATGPAKRVYSMTGAGSLFLRNWLKMVELHKSMLESFLGMSGESAREGRVREDSVREGSVREDKVADEPDQPAAKPEAKKASGRRSTATKASATKKTAAKKTATKTTATKKANSAAATVSDPIKPVSKVKPAGRKTARSSPPGTRASRKKTNKATD